MKLPTLSPAKLKVLAVLLPLGALLLWVALRTGPMAPIPVTEVQVRQQALTPQLFGLGMVQARQLHTLGPTVAGRVQTLRVDVGDSVQAGQVLGSMDPVDLDARIRALEAAQARAQASVQEAQTRQHFAAAQLQRYAQLAQAQATSAESLHLKRQERDVAQAALAAAHQELQRTRAEVAALRTQRQHLQLIAPQAAIVTARAVEPGSTVVAGQTVLELVVPSSVWIHLRLDQSAAVGLAAGLPASIRLRSRGEAPLPGVSGVSIVDAVHRARPDAEAQWLPTLDDAEAWLRTVLEPGDLCLTVGAGDVWRLGPRLVEGLRVDEDRDR